MKTSDITDPVFLEAVRAVDGGDTSKLEKLLTEHPRLVKGRLPTPTEQGYFKNPYLLWFVADNPIRHAKLPENIMEVTRMLVEHVRKQAPESFQQQIDYVLGLVATGRIPKECGVQNELMDMLITAGAHAEGALGAIAHGNPEAARHLILRGAPVNLAVAICLELEDDIGRLSKQSSDHDLQVALVAAAFCGNAQGIAHLLKLGTDPNIYLDPAMAQGFHSHATALHQAVFSGSLEAVKLLVEAGATIDLVDRVFGGTPVDWAAHMSAENPEDDEKNGKYRAIASYLKSRGIG